MGKMKIAYICSSESWGGLEMNQLRNAVWMHARGHEVVVLCIQHSPIDLNAETEKIPRLYIQKHRKYYDLSAGFRLAKLILEQKISHVIIRDVRDMSVCASAKMMNKSFHLSYFMEMQLGVKKTNLLHTIRFRAIDLWSCPLNWLEKQVHTMTRFDTQKTCVIPSGLELAPFQTALTQADARQEIDLPTDKIIIGLIGRFDPHKGQVLLLEALKYIYNSEVAVCLLGEPTRNEGTAYFEKIQQTIAENKLDDRVFIRPFRKDIATFYRAIDVFVMASKAETFGMVTIEAMASGTPTIGSNAGGTPEILEFGKLGYLFTPLDAIDLGRAINEYVSNPSFFESKKLQAVSEKYDHESVCERVEKELM